MQPNSQPKLVQEAIRHVVKYDRTTGIFTWCRDNKAGKLFAGDVVSGRHDGVLSVRIGHQRVPCNRLAWFLTYGSWPSRLSFIDGDADNLRIGNLVPRATLRRVLRWRSLLPAGVALADMPEGLILEYQSAYQSIGNMLRKAGLSTREQIEAHIRRMGLPDLLRPLPLDPPPYGLHEAEPEGVDITDTLSEDEVQALLDEQEV